MNPEYVAGEIIYLKTFDIQWITSVGEGCLQDWHFIRFKYLYGEFC